MARRLALASALTLVACAPTPRHGGGLVHQLAVTPVSSTDTPEAAPTVPAERSPRQTRASRNAARPRRLAGPAGAGGTQTAAPAPDTSPITAQGAGARVTSTAYCETGRTANGQHPYVGSAAANRWPFGTRLHIVELGRDVTVNDRIGSGSDLDIAMPGDCPAAIRYGRRTVTVQVVAA